MNPVKAAIDAAKQALDKQPGEMIVEDGQPVRLKDPEGWERRRKERAQAAELRTREAQARQMEPAPETALLEASALAELRSLQSEIRHVEGQYRECGRLLQFLEAKRSWIEREPSEAGDMDSVIDGKATQPVRLERVRGMIEAQRERQMSLQGTLATLRAQHTRLSDKVKAQAMRQAEAASKRLQTALAEAQKANDEIDSIACALHNSGGLKLAVRSFQPLSRPGIIMAGKWTRHANAKTQFERWSEWNGPGAA